MKSVLSALTRSLVGSEKMHGLKLLALLCLLFALFPFQAAAQEATIVGTVTDPTGAAVPNVAIAITNTDTAQVRHVTSNAVGEYVAPDLHIGHFLVRAEATGFKASERKDILLEVGDRTRVDFKLELGSTTQSITVEATPVAVQTDTGEVSAMINGRQITDIALNGRTFYNMVALLPGTSSLMPDSQLPTPVNGNASVSFNGNRMTHNIYLLDGGEDLDRGGAGTMSVMPSQDAIAEFRALSSNYSADYGLSSAGTMAMVLKSGTKQFHATAWEFDRNNYFAAINAFNRGTSKLRFNIYGFNVGGPVSFHEKAAQHKTFFFYNMEWRKQIAAAGVINQPVPLTTEYGGAFPSGVVVGSLHTPCSNDVSAAIAAQFAANGQTLSTAASPTAACTAAAGATLVPFTNNTIPTGLLNLNAQALLAAKIFPAPTATPGAGAYNAAYVASVSAPTFLREETGRVDHQFSDKFSVFGHWISEQMSTTYATTMWSGDNVPSVGNTYGNPSYSAVAHAIYSISPTLINETAFNYNGNRIHILPAGSYAAPSGYTFARIFPGPNADNRVPQISLGGATGANESENWVPWNNAANDYQIRDDVSWAKGAHQFKFGGSWALYKKVQDVFADTEGNFGFNGFYTGNDVADFLLGYANSYSEDGVHDSGHWNNVSWAGYAQDNWRATKRLTLNLGLRWDGAPHTYEANNRFSDFYPNLWNPANAAVFLANGTIDPVNTPAAALGTSPNSILAGYQFYLNGVGLSGQAGIPKGMVNDHWAEFGPRLGFAYDLTGSGKTVIRGGFGIMYERVQGNDMYDGGTDVPFSASASLNNVSLESPKLNVGTGNTITIPPAPIVVASFTGLDRYQYSPPMSMQYSIGVERQLGPKAVLSVAYVGTQNRHQSYDQEINIPPQSDLATLIANGDATYNTLVPYRGFRAINMSTDAENAHYNGLQLSLRGQVKSDLTIQAAYTYSKAIDASNPSSNGGDVNNDSNPYDRNYDTGPSIYDRRQVFVANFIYSIPLLKHSPSRALRTGLGGWELSGIVTAEAGSPLQITLGGTAGSNGVPGATNRPDVTSISYTKTEGGWFNQSAFSKPTAGNWGNLGWDAVYGPGRDNWNLSLFKDFTLSEARGSRLELRFETFNTFNHVQWSGVDAGFTDSRFGQVTGAYDPRIIQLGLKLYF